jgi:hypothetical protein
MAQLLLQEPGDIQYLHRWIKSLLPGHSPLRDETPWITFKAISWLEARLSANMRVFEYGSGGSTFFFSRRVLEVISVEHDYAYHATVSELIKQKEIANCTCILQEPVPFGSLGVPAYSTTSFTSFANRYAGMSFENYVRTIDKYADQSFDLVVVDGRARASCIAQSLTKIRRGGFLVLDNSERPGYRGAKKLLERYSRHDFPGIVPSNMMIYQTSIWIMD